MALNLRNLRLFLAVAEEMHFSSAARRMHIAQPALSRAIRQLENALGADLFKRSTRKVALTDAGRLFQRHTERALNHLDIGVRRVRETVAGEAGSLHIGYMDFAIEGAFPNLLRAFRSRYPNVHVDAGASFTERIISDLGGGKIDVGFVVGPVREPGVETFTVQNDRFVAVVPQAHPLAHRSAIYLRDLAGEPLVLGRRSRWAPYLERMDAIFREAGFTPRLVQEADTTESIFAFVASGIGCTLYVERAFHYEPPGVRVLALKDVPATVSTEVAWRRDEGNAVTINFVNLCRELIPAGKHRTEAC